MAKLEKIRVKDVPLSTKRWRELRVIASRSMYRMNAGNAKMYAFWIHAAGHRHMDGTISQGDDYSGGWDDSALSVFGDTAQYALSLSDGSVYKVS